MSKLTDILMVNSDNVKAERQVVFSTRPELMDAEGQPMMATIKPMSSIDFGMYQKRCTKFKGKGKNKDFEFDTAKYNQMIVLNHVVDPDFKLEANLEKAGVKTPEQLMDHLLSAGEIANLAQEVLEASGFDNSIEDIKDEVKNS